MILLPQRLARRETHYSKRFRQGLSEGSEANVALLGRRNESRQLQIAPQGLDDDAVLGNKSQ